jgi:hypothetical protein
VCAALAATIRSREISHDPENAELLREMLRDHPDHVVKSGVAMTNLWANLQEQMKLPEARTPA